MTLIGSAWLTFGSRVVIFGLALIANIILARILGPTARGIYAICVLVPSIVTLFATLGIGAANVYHVSRDSLDRRRVVGVSLLATLCLGAGAYTVVAWVIWLFGTRLFGGIPTSLLLVSGISIPFLLGGALMQGILHGEKRFIHLNIVLMTQAAILTALLVTLIFSPFDRLNLSVGAWTVSAIASTAVALVFVGQTTPLSLAAHMPTLRELLRYGSLTYLATLTSFVNYRFDLLLVNVFAGATQVGLYAVGAGVAEVIWLIPNSATIAVAPRVAAADDAESAALSAQVARSVLAVTALSALLIALLAYPIVWLVFGPAFSQSVLAIWLLLPGVVAFSVWKIMSCYLMGRTQLKQDLLAATFAMVVTIVLDLMLIPRFGFRGAALVSSLAYAVAMFIDLYWVTRRSGLSVQGWLVPAVTDAQPFMHRIKMLPKGW